MTEPTLGALSLTYAPVGTTLDDDSWWLGSRAGFRSHHRTVQVGDGQDCWVSASSALLRWDVKRRSGFTLETAGRNPLPTTARATVGERHWLVARFGPFRVREPIEVVAVVDEPERAGLAYGTLDGHPVSGEEAFLLTREPDGSVWLTVRSLSRPGRGAWRLAYPLVKVAQLVYRRRYARALP